MTNRACLAGVALGDGLPAAVMGALNVSPESFHQGSVVTTGDRLLRMAESMAKGGAALIDVGAMSTAPYLSAAITESEEAQRLSWAVDLLATRIDVPISADTSRSGPARAALEAGARVVNDVTGLTGDPLMADLVSRAGAGVILMASERGAARSGGAIGTVAALLEESLGLARAAGIDPSAIVVDPGIGFFRRQMAAWHAWDCEVLSGLAGLCRLGRPICVGVSRKSFIGAVAGVEDPAGRLPGSLAAATAAVLRGAHLIRTHDVEETVQAVRVAEAIRHAPERT